MNLITLIFISLLFASCASNNFTYINITKLNSSVKLEEAKQILKDYYDVNESFETKIIDEKNYTIIKIYRETKKTIRSEPIEGGLYNNLTVRDDQSMRTNVTKYSKSLFYVIYEGDIFLFAGYGYELRSNHNRNQLIAILEKAKEKD